MGIWIELGLFLLALGFGFWQLRDVKKAQAERVARERAAANPAPQASVDADTRPTTPR